MELVKAPCQRKWEKEKEGKRIKIWINSKIATSTEPRSQRVYSHYFNYQKENKKSLALPLYICIFITEISQFSQVQYHFKSVPSGIFRYSIQHTSYSTQNPQHAHLCSWVSSKTHPSFYENWLKKLLGLGHVKLAVLHSLTVNHKISEELKTVVCKTEQICARSQNLSSLSWEPSVWQSGGTATK